MSPETWESAWQPEQLTRFSAELLGLYPADTRPFLARFGFPREVEFGIYRFYFSPMLGGLETLDADHDYLVIGELDIHGGALLVCCLSRSTGHIVLVDLDTDMPDAYVDADLAAFGLSLRAIVVRHQARIDGSEPASSFADDVAADLLGIDPTAFDDDMCFWFGVVEFEHS